MSWRRAAVALDEGDPTRSVRLVNYARSLLREEDELDYETARRSGRVTTVRPPEARS